VEDMGIKTEGDSGLNEDSFVSKDKTAQKGQPRMTYGERFDSTFGSNSWSERPGKETRTTFRNPIAGTRLGDLIDMLRSKK
jgi:hypothetical protein